MESHTDRRGRLLSLESCRLDANSQCRLARSAKIKRKLLPTYLFYLPRPLFLLLEAPSSGRGVASKRTLPSAASASSAATATAAAGRATAHARAHRRLEPRNVCAHRRRAGAKEQAQGGRAGGGGGGGRPARQPHAQCVFLCVAAKGDLRAQGVAECGRGEGSQARSRPDLDLGCTSSQRCSFSPPGGPSAGTRTSASGGPNHTHSAVSREEARQEHSPRGRGARRRPPRRRRRRRAAAAPRRQEPSRASLAASPLRAACG